MRQIEQLMCNAVLNGKRMSRDNTMVVPTHKRDGTYHSAMVYLHGSEIAHYYWSGEEDSWVLRLRDASWRTVTTKSRLNALLEGVGKGERLRVYSKGWESDLKTTPAWFYQMGANHYRWVRGTATFLAQSPKESCQLA